MAKGDVKRDAKRIADASKILIADARRVDAAAAQLMESASMASNGRAAGLGFGSRGGSGGDDDVGGREYLKRLVKVRDLAAELESRIRTTMELDSGRADTLVRELAALLGLEVKRAARATTAGRPSAPVSASQRRSGAAALASRLRAAGTAVAASSRRPRATPTTAPTSEAVGPAVRALFRRHNVDVPELVKLARAAGLKPGVVLAKHASILSDKERAAARRVKP